MTEVAKKFMYDLIVIGGGSGGVACVREAAKYGAKTAVFDYVKPSTQGHTWGLGGTCINVGCIPKKLYHTAALYADHIEDSPYFGWKAVEDDWAFDDSKKKKQFNWAELKNNINDYIETLNMSTSLSLKTDKVDYKNELVSFIDKNTIETVDKDGKKNKYTSKYFIVAVGGRPQLPSNVEGAKEYAITSDDVFALKKAPGKTLCVGASYISLETAGFLSGLGYDVTVAVRSIILRGFDRQMAGKIKQVLENHEVSFLQPYSPLKIEKIKEQYKVTLKNNESGEIKTDIYDTVFFATGRYPDTTKLGCDKLGMKLDKKGKIITDIEEKSNIDNIYAIGDVKSGGLELTPVAVLSGKLLARRLFNGSKTVMDYDKVATTVFTPLEYGSCGLSEEAAIAKYGKENLEIYSKDLSVLEFQQSFRQDKGFIKLICDKKNNERIVGLHYLGPNAGEVTQGFALAIKLNATKEDLDLTVGIHPTNAELFTKLTKGPSSGGCST